jgi:hypothetical protein
VFDADQNISDFKENNNDIKMVYGLMEYLSFLIDRDSRHARGKKKGAQRAPLTPTESLEATA